MNHVPTQPRRPAIARTWPVVLSLAAWAGGTAQAADPPRMTGKRGAACVVHRGATASIKVQGAWARATVPAQPTSGAFLEIDNEGAVPVTLTGACSPLVGMVQIHEMHMQGDVMEMREVPQLSVPAHGHVVLKSGELHLMLLNLSQPLQAGTVIPLVLRFDHGDLAVQVPVRSPRRGAWSTLPSEGAAGAAGAAPRAASR